MHFSFNGTAVSILGVKDVDCGLADIFLDGSFVETIDTFADSRKYRKSLFSAYGLEVGNHDIRLVVKACIPLIPLETPSMSTLLKQSVEVDLSARRIPQSQQKQSQIQTYIFLISIQK